jgi:DNA-binding MarR family transcriptional regulator
VSIEAAAGENPQPPSLLYMVKQLELAIRSHLDTILKASGITTTQYTALTVLERHDGLSAAQLARDSFVTAQSMADMVRALESRTLIRREQAPENRRELRIYLTDQGRALLDKHADEVEHLERQMTTRLAPRQTTELRSALNACRKSLN